MAVDLTVRLSASLLPAVALHFLLALPDGVLGTDGRRRVVGAMYVGCVAVGLALLADRSDLAVWPVVLLWVIALGGGLAGAHARYQAAGATDRRRMQWVGWALAVGGRGRAGRDRTRAR